jgi:hypothetical protein
MNHDESRKNEKNRDVEESGKIPENCTKTERKSMNSQRIQRKDDEFTMNSTKKL